MLTAALGGGVVAGPGAAQTRARAASVGVAARRPAGPGAEASIHGHVADLFVTINK